MTLFAHLREVSYDWRTDALEQITPTQFLETINAINEILLSAHSLGHAFVDNTLAYFSLQISRVLKKTHYEKVSLAPTLIPVFL